MLSDPFINLSCNLIRIFNQLTAQDKKEEEVNCKSFTLYLFPSEQRIPSVFKVNSFALKYLLEVWPMINISIIDLNSFLMLANGHSR